MDREGWRQYREGKIPTHEESVLGSVDRFMTVRQRYEKERGPDDPLFEDSPALLNETAQFIRMQGFHIAHLVVAPGEDEELLTGFVEAEQRNPAWMEMQVFGEGENLLRLFARGCSLQLAEHREALEQIAADQIDEPDLVEEIERVLARYPVPDGEEEPLSRLFSGVSDAMSANLQAILIVARHLDRWVAREIERLAREDEEEDEDFDGDEYDDDEDDECEYDEDDDDDDEEETGPGDLWIA